MQILGVLPWIVALGCVLAYLLKSRTARQREEAALQRERAALQREEVALQREQAALQREQAALQKARAAQRQVFGAAIKLNEAEKRFAERHSEPTPEPARDVEKPADVVTHGTDRQKRRNQRTRAQTKGIDRPSSYLPSMRYRR